MAEKNEELVLSIVSSVDEKSLRATLKTIEKEIKDEEAAIADLQTQRAAAGRKRSVVSKISEEISERQAKLEEKKSIRDLYRNAAAYKEQQKLEVRQGELAARNVALGEQAKSADIRDRELTVRQQVADQEADNIKLKEKQLVQEEKIANLNAAIAEKRIAATNEQTAVRNAELDFKKEKEATRQREKAEEAERKRLAREEQERRKGLKKNLGLIGKVARKFENVTIARIARSLLNTILRTIRTGVSDLYNWSKARNGLFAKAADSILQDFRYIADIIGSIVGPFIEALAPVIRRVADAFAVAAENANKFFAALLGRNGYYKALRVARQYAGLQNQLLGFDELNVLKGDNGSGGGNFVEIAYSGFAELSNAGKLLTVAGYLQMGLGALFLFTGHPWLGLGMIASGFATATMAHADSGNEIAQKLKGWLTAIEVIAGGATLALGVMLLSDPTKWPMAIGLIGFGAASLVSAVALNWDGIASAIRGVFGDLTAYLGSQLLVIGAVLAFGSPHMLPLGLGLMAAGAVALAASGTVNWDSMVTAMKDPVSRLMMLLSGSMLAIGAILLFSGAGIGLGLGLMLAGAAGLATTMTFPEWGNKLFDEIGRVLDNIAEKIKTWWKEHITDRLQTTLNTISRIGEWIKSIFDRSYSVNYTMEDITGKTPHYDPYTGQVYYYAQGGLPKTGTLFYAGESGPELVTSFNNQATVYNETQLSGSLAQANQGVIAAVYDMANAVVNAIENVDTSININDVRNAINGTNLRYGI